MALSIHIALSSPFLLEGGSSCRSVLTAWQSAAPELFPTHAGNYEPIRLRLDPSDVHSTLEVWDGAAWIARRARPHLRALKLTSPRGHSTLHIHIKLDRDVVAPFAAVKLGDALARVLEPDFAMVHVLTGHEANEAVADGRPDTMVLSPSTGEVVLSPGFTKQLTTGLPTLYWRTYFGSAYASIINRAALAGGSAAVESTRAATIIQLTERPPDEESWDAYRERRESAMDAVGRGLFWPGASLVPAAFVDFQPRAFPNGTR